MARFIQLSAIIFFSSVVFSQQISDYKYDYNWITGIDSTASPSVNKYDDILHFDFNEDTLIILKQPGLANFKYTSASISDRNGNLQFFTNGCHVFNKNIEIMDNGESINNPVVINDHCNGVDNTGYFVTQGALILPRIDNDTLFDLLTLEYEQQSNFYLIMKYLHHSVIDMSKNNGLGSVVTKNTEIINDSLGGLLTGIRSTDNKNWWVITKKEKSSLYFVISFDHTGYKGMHMQNIGIYDKENDITGNGSAFSPDGSKYAHYEPRQGLFLYDFDRENGSLSNFKLLDIVGLTMDTLSFGFISFSPNSRFIYVANGYKLWQVDTEIDSLKLGLDLVAETDFKANPNTPFSTSYGVPTLGPDCRIYIGMFGAQPWFTVIDRPNEKGKACNVLSAKTKLPMRQWPAFPNMINYRLGTGEPVCDSNKVVLTATNFIIRANIGPLNVYPNPGLNECSITGFGSKEGILEFVSTQGAIQTSYKIKKGVTIYHAATEDLLPGIYIIRFISQDGGMKVCKWVKM